MSSNNPIEFTKENLDFYLKELAKEFRRRNGKTMPAEIILIGGASILINYGFRNMTTDIDALILASSSMQDAINFLRDKYELPNGWLNSDFKKTASYSPNIARHSVYYRTYSNILTFRTLSTEYLIAMKLRAGRKYKHDLSDVLGILAEHEKCNDPITWTKIDTAVTNLYGGWDSISTDALNFIKDVLDRGNYEELYAKISSEEYRSRRLPVHFDQTYPGVTKESNVNDIINMLRDKQK